MAEYYFSVQVDESLTLCLAPLTDRRLAASGQDIPDTSGYFLYERRGDDDDADIEIIAHMVSDEAALKLREILRME